MNTQIIDHITVSEKSSIPRLSGHRLTVHFIVYLIYHERLTPEQVSEEYSLSLGKVFAALSFYHDNKTQIDDLIAREGLALETVENLNEPGEDILQAVVTVQEIARIFGVDESTVREAATKGWIYGRKAGGTWLINRKDAEARWGNG